MVLVVACVDAAIVHDPQQKLEQCFLLLWFVVKGYSGMPGLWSDSGIIIVRGLNKNQHLEFNIPMYTGTPKNHWLPVIPPVYPRLRKT